MKIDMHFHSTKSDGTNTPEERIRQAQEKQLDFIALTDHDVISEVFQEGVEQYGIPSTQSVEISARDYDLDRSLHITAYAQKFSQEISDVLQNTKDQKIAMISAQIEKIQELGFIIDIQAFYIYVKNLGRLPETANKFDIVSYMFCEKQNISLAEEITGVKNISIVEFLEMALKESGQFYNKFQKKIKDYEPSLDVCKQLQQSHNAVLALAHPNFTFKGGIEQFQAQLPHYIQQAGINALEINSRANKQWVDVILEQKNKHGLFLTFGSDNHENGHSDEKHGDFGDQNPFITPQERKNYFDEYSHMILSK